MSFKHLDLLDKSLLISKSYVQQKRMCIWPGVRIIISRFVVNNKRKKVVIEITNPVLKTPLQTIHHHLKEVLFVWPKDKLCLSSPGLGNSTLVENLFIYLYFAA